MDEDLRREIVGAPRPVVYTVSMLDDGNTLSGIARLFYGDATKWRRIYEANRKLIKNPNVIYGGMQLTIPKPARTRVENCAARIALPTPPRDGHNQHAQPCSAAAAVER